MTLLITGSTGLVGQSLVQYLVEKTEYNKKPQKVKLLIRKKEGNPQRKKFIKWCTNKGLDIFYGDLKNDKDVNLFTKVSDPRSSVLIHSGAIFNFWEPYELLYNVNVLGTKRIIKAFHHQKIRKMIYLSSIAVYGTLDSTNGRGLTEDNPISFHINKNYELTKAIGEKIIQKYQSKYPKRLITILRPSGIVGGVGTTLDTFSRMFFGHYVSLPRGGQDKISLVDVNDVVRAIVFFSDFKNGNNETFNLVSFTPTLREFTQELGKALNIPRISIISIPIFLFKPLFYFARSLRRIIPAKENSLLLPILFDKLGNDIWIDDEKVTSFGFKSKVDLEQSMQNYGNFIDENPWYTQKKFRITL